MAAALSVVTSPAWCSLRTSRAAPGPVTEALMAGRIGGPGREAGLQEPRRRRHESVTVAATRSRRQRPAGWRLEYLRASPLGSVPPGPHPRARPPGYNPRASGPKKNQYLRCRRWRCHESPLHHDGRAARAARAAAAREKRGFVHFSAAKSRCRGRQGCARFKSSDSEAAAAAGRGGLRVCRRPP